MNQIPAYQHPFVDVFKVTKLTEWQSSQKEGDVTEVYDKQLAKNVIKVSGVTPASNYFQVPQQSQLAKKPLGLIGKYVSDHFSSPLFLKGLFDCERASRKIFCAPFRLHLERDKARASFDIKHLQGVQSKHRSTSSFIIELEWQLNPNTSARCEPSSAIWEVDSCMH